MKKAVYFLLSTFFTLAALNHGQAQTAVIDPSFNPTDLGFGLGDGPNNNVRASALQSNGKIIICGEFDSYNGIPLSKIARLNADGVADPTFDLGVVTFSGYPSDIDIQSDGKIIVSGIFTASFSGASRSKLARLNEDGTLDNTFVVPSGIINMDVYSVSIQSDGKIIVAGGNSGFGNNKVIRLNSDGTLDATFDSGNGITGDGFTVRSTSIQSDGKIIIGGTFTAYNGTSRKNIARLNTDGTIDTSFIPGNGFTNGDIYSVAIQNSGKIIIGGNFTFYDDIAKNRVARLNSNGSTDDTFASGTGTNNRVEVLIIQLDEKIIMGGSFSSYNGTTRNSIVRLNSDGTLDDSFDTGPGVSFNSSTASNYIVLAISVQNDGRVLMSGDFPSYGGAAKDYNVRLNPDGTLDTSFNSGTGINGGSVKAMALQGDGKILIGGNFRAVNGEDINRIARLNSDGSLDNTFDIGTGAGGFAGSNVYAISVQTDEKIIIAGDFITYNGVSRNRIARLNSDGTLDVSFDPGTGLSNAFEYVKTTAIQLDGKIIIGGNFTGYNGTTRNKVARLLANGALDTTFDPGIGPNFGIETAALQADGKIIICGYFTSYDGVSKNRIVRLNDNGSLDNTFTLGTGANETVLTSVFQPDGKIIIGGGFFSYNGSSANRIVRLNADGIRDNTFNSGSGANNSIEAIVLQSDGKIIIGGYFTLYNGSSRNRVARLNSDGTLDASFDPGSGSNGLIDAISVQSDGKIIIGGSFTSYNGSGKNKIARMCVAPAITSTAPATTAGCSGGSVILGATASGGTLNWYASPTGGAFLGTGTTFATPHITTTTNYYVEVVGEVDCSSSQRTVVVATVNTTPMVTDIISATSCDPGTVDLGAIASGGILNWFSTSTGGTILGTGNSFTTPILSTTTSFYVEANSSGCVSARREIIATINSKPTITKSPDGETVTLTSSSAIGNQWYKDGATISGETNDTLIVSTPGIYKVQVTVDDCVSEFSNNLALIVTGDVDANRQIQNRIYPNPAVDQVEISLHDFVKDKPISIRITDMQGRNIADIESIGQKGVVIDISNYREGNYITVMKQLRKTASVQFIKIDKK